MSEKSGWQAHAESMRAHGAQMGGIYSQQGDIWGQVGCDKATKAEVETLCNNIRQGKREMHFNGKNFMVMDVVAGQSITGKAKKTNPDDDSEERPLVHCRLGKNQCVYLAGACGGAERNMKEVIESKFSFLSEY